MVVWLDHHFVVQVWVPHVATWSLLKLGGRSVEKLVGMRILSVRQYLPRGKPHLPRMF